MKIDKVTYQVTPEMLKRAINDYFWGYSVGRRWIVVLAMILGGILLRHPNMPEHGQQLSLVFLFVGGFFIVLYLKSYQQHLQMGQDAINLHDSTEVTVYLSEDSIKLIRADSQRQYGWDRITRTLDSKNSLLLLSNKTPVCNLPKKAFTAEQLDFIKEKAKNEFPNFGK